MHVCFRFQFENKIDRVSQHMRSSHFAVTQVRNENYTHSKDNGIIGVEIVFSIQ